MALFGRETPAQSERIERVRRWVQARTPYGPVSTMLGLAAVVDSITMVIGVAMGLGAVVSGVAGLRDLARQPALLGRRLCYAGIVLGSAGLLASAAVWCLLTGS